MGSMRSSSRLSKSRSLNSNIFSLLAEREQGVLVRVSITGSFSIFFSVRCLLHAPSLLRATISVSNTCRDVPAIFSSDTMLEAQLDFLDWSINPSSFISEILDPHGSFVDCDKLPWSIMDGGLCQRKKK